MPTKSALSEQRLLVDRLMRIDQGYFERDQVRIVPTYHLICTQTGEKLAKIELVSTNKTVNVTLKFKCVFQDGYTDWEISSNSSEKDLKNLQRHRRTWVFAKFCYFLWNMTGEGSFEETVISLFP